ncbi:hypothetical protein Flexsi_1352 [Flexistipes sinusarabici DSM 4947]|uniref:Uncharacterized protein n=1 Tax=Flexistipes sinusarabici (strain ATCC 49648 / DSM 4947 / MAS 10) TaxID=717231 RepID=F8E7T4_FLESM|nr:hypothetical protein [Flexistipes sinusarabici]AEI15002.1 hypothetical protein Flexsi_1352 [Flexistipes sinusarabici DSM 4947]
MKSNSNLEELFRIYLEHKNDEEVERSGFERDGMVGKMQGDYSKFMSLFNTSSRSGAGPDKPSNYELGELYIVDDMIFLLAGEHGNFYFGYKVTEWVEFATHEDFVFKFSGNSWMVILSTELYISREKLGSFIGALDEEYADALYEYMVNDYLEEKFTGRKIPIDDYNYLENQFRILELKKVADYCFGQFIAMEEDIRKNENEIINLNDLKERLSFMLKNTDLPNAAFDARQSAIGENFILIFDPNDKILTITISEKLLLKRFAKMEFFGNTFYFYIEKPQIEIEVPFDFINVDYLAENIRVVDENDI